MGWLLGHHPWEFMAAWGPHCRCVEGIHARGQGRGVMAVPDLPSATGTALGRSKVSSPGLALTGIALARSLFMGASTGHRSWDLVTLDEGQNRLRPKSPGVASPAVS